MRSEKDAAERADVGFSQPLFEQIERSRKMTTTRVRMLAGLAVALFIGLPTVAYAADGKLTARLEGTRNDEQAMGGAEWFSEGEGRHMTFKVRVAHVSTTELARYTSTAASSVSSISLTVPAHWILTTQEMTMLREFKSSDRARLSRCTATRIHPS